MSSGLRFVDSFWETDFNGNLGFDLLCKHTKEGQKTCKDIEEFFRKKSKAQQQYSKSLRGLIRSADIKEATGGLGRSWAKVKEQTEATARYYETSAHEYNKLADDLWKFLNSSKMVTKQLEDRVKEKQKAKKTLYNRTMDLKSVYFEKCQELLQIENQYDVTTANVTSNQKEREKLKVRLEKSQEAMQKSDHQYKQTTESLEQARVMWESEMEEACDVYQTNEEERIYLLRDILWKSANIDSQLCVDWDQSNETIRLCLEKCDVGCDVDEFITSNKTGFNRPVPIVYENYFPDKQSNKSPNNPGRPLPPIPGETNSAADYSYTEIRNLTKR